MSDAYRERPSTPPRRRSLRIAALLDELAVGLTGAQRDLDADAIGRRQSYLFAPAGARSLPPLWFHFQRVHLDLEVWALRVDRSGAPALTCELIDPVMAALTSDSAQARSRLSVVIEPTTRLSGGRGAGDGGGA